LSQRLRFLPQSVRRRATKVEPIVIRIYVSAGWVPVRMVIIAGISVTPGVEKAPIKGCLLNCYRRNRVTADLTIPLCRLLNAGATFLAKRPYERNLCVTNGATFLANERLLRVE